MGKKAIVVGGGSAGLAAAIGLRERGWDVDVLKQAPAFEEVGASSKRIWPAAAYSSVDGGVGLW